jgi:hypothetical protein
MQKDCLTLRKLHPRLDFFHQYEEIKKMNQGYFKAKFYRVVRGCHFGTAFACFSAATNGKHWYCP